MERLQKIWGKTKHVVCVTVPFLALLTVSALVVFTIFWSVNSSVRRPTFITADMAELGVFFDMTVENTSADKPGTVLGEFTSRYGNYKITVSVPKVPEELTDLLGNNYVMIYHECLANDFGPADCEVDSSWSEDSKACRADLLFYETSVTITLPGGNLPINQDLPEPDYTDFALIYPACDAQTVISFTYNNFGGCEAYDSVGCGRDDRCQIDYYEPSRRSSSRVYDCINAEQRDDKIFYVANPKDTLLGRSQCTPTTFTPTDTQINRLKVAMADSPLL